MKKILIGLLLIILLLPAVYAAQQKVYILNLENDNGKIIKESLIVTQGFFIEDKNQPENGYRLELVSFTDEVLYTKKFNFSQLQKGPLPKDSDILEMAKYLPDIAEKEPSALKTSQIELIMPYYGNAKLIRVYDEEGKKLLEIDVAYMAVLCNDSICQDSESHEVCPTDCPSGGRDDYCDGVQDKKCDPDCSLAELDKDCEKPKGTGKAAGGIVVAAVIVVLISALVIVVAHLKSKGGGDAEGGGRDSQ